MDKLSQSLLTEINTRRQPNLPLYPDPTLYGQIETFLQANDSVQGSQHIRTLQTIEQQTLERKYLKIIHETTNKQNSIFNQQLSQESSKQKFMNKFNEILQHHQDLLVQNEYNHCHIHLYESPYAYHTIICVSQKLISIDSIQFKQNYTIINAWSNANVQLIGAKLGFENGECSFGQSNITTYNASGINVYEIKCDSFNFPQAYITNNQQETPTIQLFANIDNRSIPLLTTFLVEQPSLLSRLQNQVAEMIVYVYSRWNKDDVQRKKSSLKACAPKIGHYNLLTPIQESNAENFASSAKSFLPQTRPPIDDLDKFTSNLLSKYGLDTDNIPKQQTNYNSRIFKTENSLDITDMSINKSQQYNFQSNLMGNYQSNNFQQPQNIIKQTQMDDLNFNQTMNEKIYPQQQNYEQQNNKQQIYDIQYHSNQQYEPQINQQVNYDQYNPQLIYESQYQYESQYINNQQLNQPYQYEVQYTNPEQYGQQQLQYMQQMQQQYQTNFQQLMVQQYLQHQQQIQQQPQTSLFSDIKHSLGSSTSPTSIENLKTKSEQLQKKSNSEDLYYSSGKNSLVAPQLSDQRPLLFTVLKKLSIRQVKLQTQNKLSNRTPKYREFGIEIVENLSDIQPVVQLNDVMPTDFIDYGQHHCQKKILQINDCLKDKGHQSQRAWKILPRPFLQLYKDTKFADMNLLIGQDRYRVHKSVMVSCSPYFQRVLSKTPLSTIKLDREINQEIIQIVIKYMYLSSLPVSQWDEITLDQGQQILQIAHLFETQNLAEDIISRIVIPKMTKDKCLEWFHNTCMVIEQGRIFKNAYDYLYKYLLRFFAHNASYIIQLSKQNDKCKEEVLFLQEQLLQIKMIKSQNFTELIYNALQWNQPDGIENILQVLMLRLNIQDHISLCNHFSKEYNEVRSGFQFRKFKINEQFYQMVGTDSFYIQKSLTPKARGRRSIFLNDKNETFSEEILSSYEFLQQEFTTDKEIQLQEMRFTPCDYELTMDLDQMNHKDQLYVVSQCFTSGTNTWRLILDWESGIGVYIQDKGSLKANGQFLNFQGDDDAFIPEATNLDFTSVLMRIEVSTDDKQLIVSRCLFHSFPSRQQHTIGYKELVSARQLNKILNIKVWMIEVSVHSAAMTYLGQNFDHLIGQMQRLSYYDLYSLLSSDTLNVKDEDTIAQLYHHIDELQNLDLLVYPLRFTYLNPEVILSLCRDVKPLRQNKLFQKYLSLMFHWKIENDDQNPLPPRKKYKVQQQQHSDFSSTMMKWLIESDHEKNLQLNVKQMKQQVEKSIADSVGNGSMSNLSEIESIKPVRKFLPKLNDKMLQTSKEKAHTLTSCNQQSCMLI